MNRIDTFPLGATITVARLAQDRYPLLHELRAREPVSWLPALDAWLVTRHDLATVVMRDAATFTVDHPGFSTAQVVGPSMLSLDGTEHRRHRTPFERSFLKRAVQHRFRDVVADFIEQLLTELAPAGAAELRRAYAGPIAVETMRLALGLTALPQAAMLQRYDTIVAAITAVAAGESISQDAHAAYADLRQQLLPALARAPQDNLLATAAGAAAGLTNNEIVANAAILLFGGIETTEGMIANAIYHLLTERDVWRAVRADVDLLPLALEESLRLEPAAAVVDRYATGDVRLGGAAIKEGELVRVSLLGANRDPALFSNPDDFDLTRSNLREHVTFAQGPHVCLGLHLARLEAVLALRALSQTLPDLHLVDAAAAAARGLIFRKPAALSAAWGK